MNSNKNEKFIEDFHFSCFCPIAANGELIYCKLEFIPN